MNEKSGYRADDFDDSNFTHVSPYQYVVRLGKTFQLAIDATGGRIDDVTRFVEVDLRGVLRPQGLDDPWISNHIRDVLSKIARFRTECPNAVKVVVEGYRLKPDDSA
jgi:hypothetical protein